MVGNFRISAVALAVSLVVSGAAGAAQLTPADLEKAGQLAQDAIILDTHIDVPYRVRGHVEKTGEWLDVGVSTGDEGDFDYPRARAGGLNGAFMSIYIPASYEEDGQPSDKAGALADQLIDDVERLVAEHPDKFAIPHSVDELVAQVGEGKISLPLGMENGSAIAGDLDRLQHFYDRGIRYITLTHAEWNHISDSSYDSDKHWGGLSPFGEELVTAMNRLGVMVDISHVSDDAFWAVMAISNTPVIASHSSARHFTPGFERNMSDDMIKALAEQGGVIQINFGSSFLTEEANAYSGQRDEAYQAYLKAEGLEDDHAVEDDFRAQWLEQHPYPFASFDETLAHFEHVVKLVGIDHVGIGSDYDGVGDSLPVGLKDVSTYPHLIAGLAARGYSDEDIRKVLGGNLMRVWRAVETYAVEH